MPSRNLPAAVTFSIGLLLLIAGFGRLLLTSEVMEWFRRAQDMDRVFAYIAVLLDHLSSSILLLCIGLTLLYTAAGIREQQHWASIISLINITLAAAGVLLLGGAVASVAFQSIAASQTTLPLIIILSLLSVLAVAIVILLLLSSRVYARGRVSGERRTLELFLASLREKGKSGPHIKSPISDKAALLTDEDSKELT